jgi:hypothetical protein
MTGPNGKKFSWSGPFLVRFFSAGPVRSDVHVWVILHKKIDITGRRLGRSSVSQSRRLHRTWSGQSRPATGTGLCLGAYKESLGRSLEEGTGKRVLRRPRMIARWCSQWIAAVWPAFVEPLFHWLATRRFRPMFGTSMCTGGWRYARVSPRIGQQKP